MTHTVVAILLLSGSAAYGSYWVIDFEGSAEGYSVTRNEETIAIEQLMLLQSADTIVINTPAGRVLLVDEHNEHHELTPENTPFVVPESGSPPRILINVRNWVASWWSTRGNQSTSTLAAISKGGFEPELIVATDGDNFLLSGTRELFSAWRGGIQPFDLSLVAESGTSLAQRSALTGHIAYLPALELAAGNYVLTIAAGDAESTARLTVVGSEQLPDTAKAILNLELPDEIRFGHLALLLSGYSHWRFEALQLAHRHDLAQLQQALLSGNFPEADIGEIDSLHGQ